MNVSYCIVKQIKRIFSSQKHVVGILEHCLMRDALGHCLATDLTMETDQTVLKCKLIFAMVKVSIMLVRKVWICCTFSSQQFYGKAL